MVGQRTINLEISPFAAKKGIVQSTTLLFLKVFFPIVIFFKIGEFFEHSDHAPIVFKLKNINYKSDQNYIKDKTLKPKVKWEDKNKNEFIDVINSENVTEDITSMINEFSDKTFSIDKAEVM